MASLKRNFFYNILLQVSKVLFPLVTAPYIARVLDPDGVGIVNFVNTYTNYFVLFAVLGIPTYAMRETAKHRHNEEALSSFVSEIFWIEIISTIVVSALFIASVYLIPSLRQDALLFVIAGISLYLTPLNIEWFFNGREEFGFVTARSLIIRTLSVIALFLFVKTKSDLFSYIIIGVVSTIMTYVWNWSRFFKTGVRLKISPKGAGRHIKPVFVLFGSAIAISVYVMLDTLMLGFESTYEEVGYYNSAMHIIKAILPMTTALSTVAIPRMSVFSKEGRIEEANRLMNQSIGIVSLIGLPVAIGLIMVSPTFIPLFLGDQFCGAILPMQIGSLVIIAIGFNNLNGIQILIGLGRDKEFFYSVLSGAITNFILNLFLIPKYGASGAAFASVIAETQIFVVNQYFVNKTTLIRIRNTHDVWKATLGAFFLVPTCLIISKFTEGWSFVTCASITGVLVYYLIEKILKNSTFTIIESLVFSKIKIKK